MRRIDLWGLTHLYVVGGNGGNAAANAINDELEAANVVCSVIAVPKSIDNDILLVGHTMVLGNMLGSCSVRLSIALPIWLIPSACLWVACQLACTHACNMHLPAVVCRVHCLSGCGNFK